MIDAMRFSVKLHPREIVYAPRVHIYDRWARRRVIRRARRKRKALRGWA